MILTILLIEGKPPWEDAAQAFVVSVLQTYSMANSTFTITQFTL